MTTPNMVTAPDGAYIIGGGEWKYGQSITEALAHSLLPPMPTPLNALALIEENLLRLPIEALRVFQPFVPNSTDEMFLTIEAAVQTIIGIFMDPISFLKSIDFTTWITGTFGPLNTIVNQLVDIFQGHVVVPFNTAIANVVAWVNALGLSAILKKFETFLTGITNIDSWLILFKEVIDFFLGITNRTAWMPVFKTLVDTFVTLTSTVGANLWTVVTGMVTAFGTLFASLGTTVWTVLGEILTFFAGITSRTNWLAAFKGVVDTFKALFDALGSKVWTILSEIVTFLSGKFTLSGDVAAWLGTIPIVGDIVHAITGVFGTLADLIEWIKNNVLKLPSNRLFGQIPDILMGVVSIGNLTSVPINLLLSPSFADTASVSPVDGWSWDSTQNATGTGGSAKVVLDGYNKELSHQTVVNVAAGDLMQLSAALKTSGVTGTGWAASISVMEYRAGAIATPVVIASRTSNSSGWVTISGAYTVPVNVTSVVFRVTVTDATAGTIWFDNLDFHKSGVVAQDWVGNLNTTWENMWSGQFGDGTGTGKIWSDMGTKTRAGRDNTTVAVTNAATAQGTANTAVTNASSAQTTANTGVTNASTAQTTANTGVTNAATADTKAVAVATGLRTTVGGETGTIGVPANAGTYLINLINKMYGTGTSIPLATINNSALQDIPFTKMLGTLSGANITTSTIPVGALDAAVVPGITASVKATTVGTGAVLARISPAGAHLVAASGQQTFGSNTNPFFNTLTRSTADITYPTSSVTYSGTVYTFYTGEFVVTLPGWYMCEVGLRINVQGTAPGFGGPGTTGSFTPNYSVTPILYKKPSGGSNAVYRYGTEAMGLATAVGLQRQRFANSSWIVYLAAGDTVQAGYDAGYIEGGTGAAPAGRLGFFGSDGTGNDSYFSIALLNRS